MIFTDFRIFGNFLLKIWIKKSQIRLKKRHTSFFSGICREIRTKFHQEFSEKMQNSILKMKNRKFIIHSRKKMLTSFGWIFEIWAVQKHVNLVDLVKSFPTSVYLQKSASIQPRTSLSKFGGKFNSLFIRLLNPESVTLSGICREIRAKFHQKFTEKIQNSTQQMKKSEIH